MARRARGRKRQDGDGELHRENVPGELDHASGEVDRVEAGIVAGGEGQPVTPGEREDGEREAERGAVAAPGGSLAGPDADGDDESATAVAPGPRPDGNRFANFLRASWAELQRVQWPDRRQVGQATAVVLGFVVLAGGYLGLADVVAQRIVDAII